jgi:hypothetical protein
VTRAAQNDPAVLSIRFVEGEGSVYPIGSRATRGITVQITDETGRPVDGAVVTFRLPDNGPTGTFSSGMRMEMVTTGMDGRANVWGMQWNRVAGPLEVRITAVKGSVRAGTICRLSLTNSPTDTARIRGGSHKKLWIGIGVAVAGFAGVASVTSRGTPSAVAPAGVNAPQIGTPTIIIGKP